MGQFTWQYLGIQDQPKTITLFHGDTTGHVLITLNSKVLVIDFNVRDTKNYSFFIEEELCEVKIEKSAEHFHYSFVIDKNVQTPLNKRIKKREKKHLIQTALFFGVIILMCFGIAFAAKQFKKQQKGVVYDGKSKVVFSLNEEDNFYTYTAADLIYKFEVEELPRVLETFPIRDGDEFMLPYSTDYPSKHLLQKMQPTAAQEQKYVRRLTKKQSKLHPQQSERLSACQVKIGYELFGLDALFDFYFQEIDPEKNHKHNSDSYKRMVRGVSFQRKTEDCVIGD